MKSKTLLYFAVVTIMSAGIIVSCSKSSNTEAVANSSLITQEDKSMVAAAGFNSNWFEKTTEGKYLIEGDILLSKAQLQEMAGANPTNNFIVANEEHYRTYN